MKYSCPSYLLPVIPGTLGTGGNDRERAEFQGATAMDKSSSGAPDLIDMEPPTLQFCSNNNHTITFAGG
jgi:hypothetical protein